MQLGGSDISPIYQSARAYRELPRVLMGECVSISTSQRPCPGPSVCPNTAALTWSEQMPVRLLAESSAEVHVIPSSEYVR
jgi:hypothetical protein